MSTEFKVGDVVQLKSGGPIMTVIGDRDGKLVVVWMDWYGHLQDGVFSEVCLKESKGGWGYS